ncbi:caspase-9 isoform X2 [Tachyglossus aculeatus]|uniref:caspase-9 isoform X2 n=1 Tax=Tachyglossus aculeatus TaxID=9261 RepID=UPI0018F51D9C|nr:caspase-9 isoform X2 [Tachyglossus aculeatus]
MEERGRQALRGARLRLVRELRVAPLWDLLLARGLFTRDMIDHIQQAGTRRDQARQLVTDLETRGRQALPVFISCLRETDQHVLAALLSEGCQALQFAPVDVRPVEIIRPGGQGDVYVKPFSPMPSTTKREQEATRPGLVEFPQDKSRRSSDLVYSLKSEPCGHCLIINNVDFSLGSELSTRTGSDVDCEKIQRRFRLLHFEVAVERNLTAEEMVKALNKLARKDHSALDCCVVVILSHGYQASHIQFPGGIHGTDGKSISVETIVNYFNGSRCPSLGGKPKLFFIQACGGEQKDRGFEVNLDSPEDHPTRRDPESDATPFQAAPEGSDEPDAVASLPTPSDILVSYSTFPGFVSWRDTKSGSWYIETLDSVLEQWAHTEDLLTLLLRVSNGVSSKGKYKQIPGCFNFLRKRLYFNTK